MNDTLAQATEALERFRSGWKSGSWKPFIALLAPGFTMRVPIGALRGKVATRDEAVHHFHLLRLAGTRLELSAPQHATAADGTAVFELEVSGQMYGRAYHNRLALIFQMKDGLVVQLREYFGELDLELLQEALRT